MFSTKAVSAWLLTAYVTLERQQTCFLSSQMGLVVVQLLNHVRLFVTPWTVALQATLSSTISWRLLKFMCIESVILSNHLILSRPLLPSFFLSVFPRESDLRIKWPKYWSFSFSISPSNVYSKLTSFRVDWSDLSAL